MVAFILAIMVAVATAAGGGVVAASDAAAPGDPLYAVDQSVEQVRQQMTRGEGQVEFLSKVANERLDEVEALYASGDEANFEVALANYNAAVEAMLASAQGGGVNADTTGVMLDESLDAQAQRLNALLDAPKDGELPDDDSGEESAEDEDLYCDGDEDHPAGLLLADLYGVSYEEVMGYYCDGYEFGEVRLAYDLSLASEVAVANIFAMAADGRTWEEIAATLGVDLDAFGDYNFDDDEITEEERAEICTSDETDPTTARLAELYGVSYDEVLGWFCAGYDFADIRMAYDISYMSGEPVGDVFDLREEFDSWDEVLVELGLLPGDDDDDDEVTRREAICAGDIHSVTGQAVADRYGVDYGDVLDWYCDGYTFSEVRLAYELADLSGESVATVFALYVDTGSWEEVLAELDLTIEDLPEQFRDDVRGDDDDDDDDDEDRDDDDDDFDDDEVGCTGADPHPVAQRLDAMYDTATYEEIVTWHCEGFGFGEIMHALATGKTVDMEPEELLEMKLEMGGWGQVWQSLDLIGKNREQGERHGPPNRVDDDDDDNGPADVSPRNDNNGRGNGNGNNGNNGRGNGNNGNNGNGNGNGKNKNK